MIIGVPEIVCFTMINNAGQLVAGPTSTPSGSEVQVSRAGAAFTTATGTITEVGGSGNGGGSYYYTPVVGDVVANGFRLKIIKSGYQPLEFAIDTEAAPLTAAGVWAAVAEGTLTYGDLMRGMISGLVGRVLGFDTGTLIFKSLDALKTRWTVVTSSSGRTTSTPGDLTP